jgi:hypothetical protein
MEEAPAQDESVDLSPSRSAAHLAQRSQHNGLIFGDANQSGALERGRSIPWSGRQPASGQLDEGIHRGRRLLAPQPQLDGAQRLTRQRQLQQHARAGGKRLCGHRLRALGLLLAVEPPSLRARRVGRVAPPVASPDEAWDRGRGLVCDANSLRRRTSLARRLCGTRRQPCERGQPERRGQPPADAHRN